VKKEELIRRIRNLEEEIRLGDNFKRSLRETLGLQVESLQMELHMEKEKVKRMEEELGRLRADSDLSGPMGTEQFDLLTSSIKESSQQYFPLLQKLIKFAEKENKEVEKGNASQPARKKLEDTIQQIVTGIKEETVFLQQHKEEMFTVQQNPIQSPETTRQLKERIAKSETNLKRLKEQLVIEQKNLSQMEDEKSLERLKKTLGLHEQLIAAMKALMEESAKKDEAVGLAKKQMEEVVKLRDADREFRENLEQKMKTQAKQIEELMAKMDELQATSDRLNQEKQEINAKLGEEEKLLSKVSQERETERKNLQKEIEALQKKLEDELALVRNANKELENLKEEKNQITKQKEELEQEKASMLKSIEELKDLRSKLEEEKETMKAFLQKEEREGKEKLEKIIQQQRETFEEEKKVLSTKMEDLIANYEKKIAQADNDIKTKTEKLQQNETEITELKLQLERERTTLAQITEEKSLLLQKVQKEKEELDQAMKDIRDNLVRLQGEVAQSKEANESLKLNISNLESDNHLLKTELDDTKAKLEEEQKKSAQILSAKVRFETVFRSITAMIEGLEMDPK
jgi:chromosome segregation ATPase